MSFTAMPCRRFFLILLLLLVWACPPAASDEPSEPGRSWWTAPVFHWYMRLDPETAPPTVTIDGASPGRESFPIKIYEGVAHLSLRLHPKENRIRVRLGEATLLDIEVFHATEHEAMSVPDEYPPYFFHTAGNEAACSGCHRMTPGTADEKPSKPGDSLCHGCHPDLMDGFVSRCRPAGEWQCLACHERDEQTTERSPEVPVRYAVSAGADTADLCYRCHEESRRRFTGNAFVHGPVAMSSCTSCHGPHGGRHPRTLRLDVSHLCVDCHARKEMVERPYVHKVQTEKGCTACHDPHGSGHPHQLKDRGNTLCANPSCHSKITRLGDNHPVKGHPVSGPRDPSRKNKRLECVSCHDPHASDHAFLLEKEEVMMVCMTCHPAGAKSIDN